MKRKLDENLSRHLEAESEALGHETATAAGQGLLGKSDAEVARAAKAADEILPALDLEFGDLRKHVPGSHPGIILFRPHATGPNAVNRFAVDFVHGTDLAELAGCLVVADPDRARVRRPPLDTQGGAWKDIPTPAP